MNIDGCVALVTGANRGVGAAFVEGLLAAGARKIYAASREPDAIVRCDPRVVPVELDVTNAQQIRRAAANAPDVTLLVNNAGVNRMASCLSTVDPDAATREMEVNYFGTLNVIRAFAPALRENGGAIVNMLSILARIALPSMGSLCASKAAALRMTESVRAELAKDGVSVLAIMPGAIDTDMSRDFPGPKIPAPDVVSATLDALAAGIDELYVGDMAKAIAAELASDRIAVQRRVASA
ncbi:SDR family oxidoreductase [Burkholderia pseudomultivorans]|uniref:SDR family oxidoreductase n=1 Tax=Burkholderia pseudomultivorans TaxID=1207504 RepID=UPI00075A33C5|nr:SDR family oxidoreductase [Burkholderia pseudomultivorans]KVC27379.1 short-chain dehydrogenase [Burkholderia pseudomultivorans]KVC37959.1 short-chain dehydrogenase [Burkholderia pseudomultivorans]